MGIRDCAGLLIPGLPVLREMYFDTFIIINNIRRFYMQIYQTYICILPSKFVY